MENNSNNTKNTEIFQVRTTNEKQNEFVITLGNQLASERKFRTRRDAYKFIKSKPWELIFALAIFTSRKTYELNISNAKKEE